MPEVLDIALEKVYDNRLGRALDRLYPHLGELWAWLASQAIRVYDLDLNVLHWDITSIYFEGAYTDGELAAYGYSRDHRPDTKQVNLEVDVTHDGYVPLLYQTLPGNTADITRPLPHLHALLRFFARPELAARHLRPILVSDHKMITPEAVFACHVHDLFYLLNTRRYRKRAYVEQRLQQDGFFSPNFGGEPLSPPLPFRKHCHRP